MNWLDGIIVIALAYGLIRGLFKGFFREAFQLLGVVLAVILAFRHFQALGSYLIRLFNWPVMVANGVSFLLISFIVAGVCYLLGLFLRRATRFLAIRWLDIIGGGGFGVLKLALILSLLLNASLLLSSPLPNLKERVTEEFDKTSLARPIIDLAPALYKWIVKVLPGESSFDYQIFHKKASKTKEKIQKGVEGYKKNREMIEKAKERIESIPGEFEKAGQKIEKVLK